MSKNTPARKVLATRTAQLPVYLTDEEMKELGKRLARHEGELGAHTQKAQDVKDDLKAKESAIRSQILMVSSIINQTYEYRPIPVRIEADFEAGKVLEIREDTGEIVAERPVNEQDRQASIFDMAPPKSGEVEQAPKGDDQAERNELEKQADAILQNAGSTDLNKKELKGPATKWKGKRS